jgi:hypothetical protein
MYKLLFALIALTSISTVQASHEPPCNHESLDEAWDDNVSGKDDNHCGHHHHCG